MANQTKAPRPSTLIKRALKAHFPEGKFQVHECSGSSKGWFDILVESGVEETTENLNKIKELADSTGVCSRYFTPEDLMVDGPGRLRVAVQWLGAWRLHV